MQRIMHFIVVLMAVCLMATQAVFSGERVAFQPLPDPIALYVEVNSPRDLVESADRLIRSAVEGTPLARQYKPGMTKAVVYSLGLPALLENKRLKLGLAVIGEERGTKPDVALILDYMPVDEARTSLVEAGFKVEKAGEGYAVGDGPAPGFTFRLYELGTLRSLLVETEESYSRFAPALRGWKFDNPVLADINGVINVNHVKKFFAQDIQGITSPDTSAAVAKLLASSLPKSWDAETKRSFAESMVALGERFFGLALDVDHLALTVKLREDLLGITMDVTPKANSALARYYETCARASSGGTIKQASDLIRAVADDALFLSSWRGGGTLFSDGGIVAIVASSLAKPFLERRGDLIDTLGEDFAANSPNEKVWAWYARESGPVLVGYDRVPDGRKRVDSFIRAADCLDKIFAKISELKRGKPDEPRIRVDVEGGKSGNIAYRRLFFDISHMKGVDIPPERKAQADFLTNASLYLAANRNTTVTVLGCGIPPEILGEAVARLDPQAGHALWDHAKLKSLLSYLNSPNSIEETVFRPSTLLVESIRWAEAVRIPHVPSGLAAELKDNGDFVMYRLGVRNNTLGFDFNIPLKALNDLVANGLKIADAGDGKKMAEKKETDGGWDTLPPLKEKDAKGDVDDWGRLGEDLPEGKPDSAKRKSDEPESDDPMVGMWEGSYRAWGGEYRLVMEIKPDGGGVVRLPDDNAEGGIGVFMANLTDSAGQAEVSANLSLAGTVMIVEFRGTVKNGEWTGAFLSREDGSDRPASQGEFRVKRRAH